MSHPYTRACDAQWSLLENRVLTAWAGGRGRRGGSTPHPYTRQIATGLHGALQVVEWWKTKIEIKESGVKIVWWRLDVWVFERSISTEKLALYSWFVYCGSYTVVVMAIMVHRDYVADHWRMWKWLKILKKTEFLRRN